LRLRGLPGGVYSLGEDIPRRIQVGVGLVAASHTAEALAFAIVGVHVTAGATGLRRVCRLYHHKFHSPPFTLVFKLSAHLAPTGVGDMLRETPVRQHVLDLQVFDNDHRRALICRSSDTHKFAGQLVQGIPADVADTQV